MDASPIIVKSSFKLTDGGIIAELNHQLLGLPRGTKLIMDQTEKSWIVKSRILFSHTEEKQIDFGNETCEAMFPSFSSAKKRLASARQILDKEANAIFMYLIQPHNHEDVPNENATLHADFGEIELPASDEEE